MIVTRSDLSAAEVIFVELYYIFDSLISRNKNSSPFDRGYSGIWAEQGYEERRSANQRSTTLEETETDDGTERHCGRRPRLTIDLRRSDFCFRHDEIERGHAILSSSFTDPLYISCNFVDTSSLHPLNFRRLSWESVSICFDIKRNYSEKSFETSLRGILKFFNRAVNFSSILKRGSDRANKIGVTARVHSRFALLAWRAQSCSIVAVDNGLLSATATNWAPIIALMHQPRRARGVTVKLPAGPLAKKGRCYRESSCKCAGTIVRR